MSLHTPVSSPETPISTGKANPSSDTPTDDVDMEFVNYDDYPPTPSDHNSDDSDMTPRQSRKDSGISYATAAHKQTLDCSSHFPFYPDDDAKTKQKQQLSAVMPYQSPTLAFSPSSLPLPATNTKLILKVANLMPHPPKKVKEIFELRDLSKAETAELEEEALGKNGYVHTKYLAKTLQGKVFLAERVSDGRAIVIKKTSKKLHKLGITVTKTGKSIKVQENIVAEAQLMEAFSANHPPTSLIEHFGFFEDTDYYYLAMENGGSDYFDFVVKCHELITQDKLSLSEWRKQSKFMFAQMVQFVRWMHVTMHCANLDVSLENMLIRDCAYYDEKKQSLNKCYIKFIDFGLAEFFDLQSNPRWLCTKYVGKTHYKAPKVYNKREVFSANQADVWSLGVCLFMMIVGAPPYNKPVDKDVTYQYIKHKQIARLLQEWSRIKYITANLHDLLTRMLTVDESKRITMAEIVRHPWICHYFPNDNKPVITASMSSPTLHNIDASAAAAVSPQGGPLPHRTSYASPHAKTPPHTKTPQTPNTPQTPKTPLALQSPYSAAVRGRVSILNTPASPRMMTDDLPPSSPAVSTAVSESLKAQDVSAAAQQGLVPPNLNIMIPQQCVSSVSGSLFSPSSRSYSKSTVIAPRKHSAPFSPYSSFNASNQSLYAHSPRVHSPRYSRQEKVAPSSPTPIAQSQTEHSLFLASDDENQNPNADQNPKSRRKKKSSSSNKKQSAEKETKKVRKSKLLFRFNSFFGGSGNH